ncbi:hypothetical protein ACFWYW_29850 [Nonomuraea sp. NPDC059023]|uniref:hypothetical protein n=1 Tax=unclassified Nonomuraea TaxID=2593643 RepID=UPI00368A4B33
MSVTRRVSAAARRWWPQGCAVVLGLCAGLLYTALTDRVYTAQAYVVVVADAPSSIEQTTKFAQAFTKIATQPAIVGAALRPGLAARTVGELQRTVRVSASPDAPMISLAASAPDAAQAAGQANALAQALITYAGTRATDTGVRIANLSQALAPEEPSGPDALINLTVGGAAGLLLGGLFYLVTPPAKQGRDKGAARDEPAARSRERSRKRPVGA